MFFSKPKKDNMWIVAGLGNPGKEYDNTRHNIGFNAIDMIANELHVDVKRAKYHSLTAEAVLDNGTPVLLMKPQTFMNLSGDAISQAASFYKIPAERVIVICDDINLAAGSLRIRDKGSAGGHNGLKDIIAKLGSDKFYRVRIGAGIRPTDGAQLPNWVLSQPSSEDKKKISSRCSDVIQIAELISSGHLSDAQSKFNH